MSFSVSDAFIQQFTGNVSFLVQQKKSRLRDTVMEDQITGESAYLEQLAPTAARKVLARHGDSPVMNTQHLRRRVAVYDYDWGDLIDQEDKVRLLTDPESNYVKNAASALGRGYDDEIIAAFFGTAFSGHSGSTALTWPNGNSESVPTQPAGTQIAVNDWTYGNGSGNVGMTVSKFISAKVVLDQAEADDDEDRFALLKAKQIGNMLATTEATSSDYAEVKALAQGKIDTFMGFKIIRTERLQLNGSGQTRCPFYTKSAVGLGIAKDIWSQIQQRPDKRYSWYPYMAMSIGASRIEEARLVEVICV